VSANHRQICGQCKAPVIFALQDNGKIVVLERCAAGEGNVAVQMPLLQGGRAQVVSLRSSVPTSYRRHIDTCKAADFYRNRWKYRDHDESAKRDPAQDLANKIVQRLGGDATVVRICRRN